MGHSQTNTKERIFAIRLKGFIDSTTADDFLNFVSNSIEKGYKKIIINCNQLDYISSAGLTSLYKLHKIVTQKNVLIVFLNPKDEIQKIFSLFGINFFPIHYSMEDAEEFLCKQESTSLPVDNTDVFSGNWKTNSFSFEEIQAPSSLQTKVPPVVQPLNSEEILEKKISELRKSEQILPYSKIEKEAEIKPLSPTPQIGELHAAGEVQPVVENKPLIQGELHAAGEIIENQVDQNDREGSSKQTDFTKEKMIIEIKDSDTDFSGTVESSSSDICILTDSVKKPETPMNEKIDLTPNLILPTSVSSDKKEIRILFQEKPNPIYIHCEVCGSELHISRSGKNQCPVCSSIFMVRNSGSVSYLEKFKDDLTLLSMESHKADSEVGVR